MRYKKRPPPGSVADLILRFRDSQRYRSWTPTTRARRDAVLANFMRMNGRMPIRDLRRADVIQMRDSLGDTPAAANNFLKALRTLLDYELDLELVEQNVARLVKDLPPGIAMDTASGARMRSTLSWDTGNPAQSPTSP